jgi:hypothetical protein
LNASCIVSASPVEAFNALGTAHTVVFFCGNAASTLPGPVTAPYPNRGCFDLHATVADVTSGAAAAYTAAQCAGIPVTAVGTEVSSGAVDCTSVANPICAIGFVPTGSSGQCQPPPPVCPTGFTYSSIDGLCHAPPTAGACPPGSTPVRNSAGTIVDCTEPLFPLLPLLLPPMRSRSPSILERRMPTA